MRIVIVGHDGAMTKTSARTVAGPLSVPDAERLAEIMQALASPVRLRVLSALR